MTEINLVQLFKGGVKAGIVAGIAAFILGVQGIPELVGLVGLLRMAEKWLKLKLDLW